MEHLPSPPHPARDAHRPLPAGGARLRGASSGSGHLSPRAGRGRIASAIRVRGRFLKGSGYRLKYTSDVAKHVVVPESKDSVTSRYKPCIARQVARASSVLSTIDLDDQTTLTTNKVNGVRADRFLANEFKAVDRTRPQPVPERQFGVRCIAPQPSCARGGFFIGSAHVEAPPHPACFARRPLPASGERLAHPAFSMADNAS